MRRFSALTALLLFAGCSQSAIQLSTGQPSLNTAHTALESGAADVALNICARIAAARRSADALTCQGDALAALGKPNEADVAYAGALVLDPGSVSALLGLGRLRLASDPKRAEGLLLLARAQNPREAAVLNNLGIARDLQGRHAEAQQAYGEAIAANPAMRAAQVNLALSTALSGRPDDAARLLLPLAGGPDASVRERHDLAAVLAMAGRTAEAARLLSPDLKDAELETAIAGYRSLLAVDHTPRQQ
jgi:Flp pilus assembly protein TadD